MIAISVQQQDFDVGKEYRNLVTDSISDGAVVTFVGLVRDINNDKGVTELELEHYPGMTEKCLEKIAQQAAERWALGRIRIIHRFGKLAPTDQIVFVATTSRHRQAAFESVAFIMDHLKTQVPFWKKETNQSGEQFWVEAKSCDDQAAKRWS